MTTRRGPAGWLAGAAAAAALAVGCGGPGMVPVRGEVTLDGRPLPKAIVAFFSEEDPGRTSNGYTDASGRFEMATFGGADGVPPGEYRVTVEHWDKDADPPQVFGSPAEAQQAAEKAPKRAKREAPVVPGVYSDHQKTPLRVRVPADGLVRLELKSAP